MRRSDRDASGIVAATVRYEASLANRIPLIAPDLELKDRAMSAGSFPFLRATFYLWAARWEEVVGAPARLPTVLAVGDLHVENFGTWRDAEGRLVWGVNDFDEAWLLPYTQDLLWLAASALVAGGNRDGSPGARLIGVDLKRRPNRWSYDAASRMADAVDHDWHEWRKARGAG